MISTIIDLNDLDGSNGFVINGIDEDDNLGSAVSSAGDINGDGLTDLIVGGPYANISSNYSDEGQAYVIFGSNGSFDPNLDVEELDGSNGFIINGINENDRLGRVVSSAGDINGDGLADLIVGVPYANISSDYSNEGQAYVILGSNQGFEASLDLENLSSSQGFVINGLNEDDRLGSAASSAGDINGDGLDDFIIGAPYASTNSDYYTREGDAYVIFGSNEGFEGNLDVEELDGSNGFVINGIDENDNLGSAVSSAGDINGDGLDDFIIGAPNAIIDTDYSSYYIDPTRGGRAYVIFGTNESFEGNLDLEELDGSNGFIIGGINENDNLGSAVSSAGDINGDGLDDFIIGAPYATSGTTYYGNAGQAYVIFGSNEGFEANLDLQELDGSNGFVINGINEDDSLGSAVSSAGDINGDGFADLILGVPNANISSDYSDEGQAYVILGSNQGFEASLNLEDLSSSQGFVINGLNEYDRLGSAVSSAGDINGDDVTDLIIGAPGVNNSQGESYVIFSVSNLEIIGTGNDDLLIGGTGSDIINGLGGNDIIRGLDGNDQISGGSGSDLITGGNNDDVIEGNQNDDFIIGEEGNDQISGNSGDDRLLGGEGDDQIRGNQGKDQILGENGDDFLNGDQEDDIIDGGDGDDTIIGSKGLDYLFAGRGNDDVDGGGDDDEIFGDSGQDNINGGPGNDLIEGGSGRDSLKGAPGEDRMFGGEGNDNLNGGRDNDSLIGGLGDDLLDGENGDDLLLGIGDEEDTGIGQIDTLTGGQGVDSFLLADEENLYYDDLDPLTRGDLDYAVVTDFNSDEDTIVLQDSADLYELDFFTDTQGNINAELIYQPGVIAKAELIAILENVPPTLSFSDPSFTFI